MVKIYKTSSNDSVEIKQVTRLNQLNPLCSFRIEAETKANNFTAFRLLPCESGNSMNNLKKDWPFFF